MRRVVFNQKGGVGKTTITCNLAAISAKNGKRTLVVDLDPQGNATQYLLGSGNIKPELTIADLFTDLLRLSLRRKNPRDYIHRTPFPGLDILPSHPDLADLITKLEARYKIYKLKEVLDAMSVYDTIYMDTPPALNFYTLCALIAADTCLIPFDCDDFSRRALYALLERVREIQEDHNSTLAVEGIIVNQFQANALFPKKIVEELKSEGLPILDTYLSSSVKIRESHEKSLPMIFLDPKHKLTEQFQELSRKLDA